MTILPISVITLLYNTSSKLGIQNNKMYEMYFITRIDNTKSKNNKFLTNRYIAILQVRKFQITKIGQIHNSGYHFIN